MIPSAESSSEINPCRNAKVKECVPSKYSKNFLVLYEKWLSFGKPHKWKRKFNCSHLRKFPFFIFFISALEVLVFYKAEEKLKRILIYDIKKKIQIWRYLTYMLLHTDSIHLGLNVVIQGLLGIPLELEQGRLRCAAIYFGGGLAGSLGASIFGAFNFMVGASGGVYALLMSQIPNVVLSYRTIKYAGFRIATVVVLTVSDVLYIFYHMYFYNNEGPQIGWVAHVSGAAAGLLLGFLLFSGTSEWRRKFQSCCTHLPSLQNYHDRYKDITSSRYSFKCFIYSALNAFGISSVYTCGTKRYKEFLSVLQMVQNATEKIQMSCK